jgi:energy-converting hydrogenase B subunit D
MIWIIISVVLGVVMIVMSVVAIHNNKITIAILSAGGVSLIASILYLLLAAPDVALTEASIGSGLTTFIFFYVLNKIKKHKHVEK